MRQTMFSRLIALALVSAASAGTATGLGAQALPDRAQAASFATAPDRAPNSMSSGMEQRAPVAAGIGSDGTPTASRSLLLDRRAAGLTRISNDDAQREAPVPRQENGNTRANTAMMIVGAAAVVLGAAVGEEAGTVLIIGGAGIGLFGLYRMLN